MSQADSKTSTWMRTYRYRDPLEHEHASSRSRSSSQLKTRAIGISFLILILCLLLWAYRHSFGFAALPFPPSLFSPPPFGTHTLDAEPQTELTEHKYQNVNAKIEIEINATAPPLPIPESIQHSWASYTPWFAAGEVGALEEGCEVVQVNILQRHGARYPTKNAGTRIKSAVQKLQSAVFPVLSDETAAEASGRAGREVHPKLEFLREYRYELGEAALVKFGAAQSFDAGQTHYARYAHLVSPDTLPFVRASGSERVIMSAENWTAGFAYASGDKYTPKLALVLSEELNNTLDDSMCPLADSPSRQISRWQSLYTPSIIARLRSYSGALDLDLGGADIGSLMSLCAFESVAYAMEGEGERKSGFCELFSEDEFAKYEYEGDLGKWYGTGHGARLGRVQGVGYVNELLARLTHTPVHDHTQTNRTLDASPITFPLNRTIYADWSHDNQMAAIYAAIGLFAEQPGGRGMDPERMDGRRTWVSARIVPFSARMVTEKIRCGAAGEEMGGEGAGEGGKEYVRIMVNDAVQPLEFCGGSVKNGGLCELGKFVESQAYARRGGEGDWEKCFEAV